MQKKHIAIIFFIGVLLGFCIGGGISYRSGQKQLSERNYTIEQLQRSNTELARNCERNRQLVNELREQGQRASNAINDGTRQLETSLQLIAGTGTAYSKLRSLADGIREAVTSLTEGYKLLETFINSDYR